MTDFQKTLMPQLSLTCTEMRRAFAQQVGMSQTRVQLLMFLSHGEMSHADLQQRLVLDGATLTRQIKQFEVEGTVSRRLDPQDNRYTLVSLTSAGQQIAAGLIAASEAFQQQLLDGIPTEEQQIILRALNQVRANVRRIETEGEK